jgi:hypothetical protein
VARIHQLSHEEHAMCVTCYLVSALGIAIALGFLIYTFFLR